MENTKLNEMVSSLRGENKRFFGSNSPRRLIVGPCGAGKTWTALLLIHKLCLENPNTRVLMCRKSLAALRNSAVQTLKQVIFNTGHENEVRILGKSRPTHFIYSNGSEIALSQIDSRSKVIGANFDIVYINELTCEGLTFNEFILVASRAREINVLPYPIVIADGSLPIKEDGEYDKEHWIHDLPNYGFHVFNPQLEDNPLYFNWTDLGREHLNSLNQLPDRLKNSYIRGIWNV